MVNYFWLFSRASSLNVSAGQREFDNSTSISRYSAPTHFFVVIEDKKKTTPGRLLIRDQHHIITNRVRLTENNSNVANQVASPFACLRTGEIKLMLT